MTAETVEVAVAEASLAAVHYSAAEVVDAEVAAETAGSEVAAETAAETAEFDPAGP